MQESSNRWLQCYMKNLTHVKYTTHELYPEYYSLTLEKFYSYLDSLCQLVINFNDFKRDLQSFLPIIVDLDTRQWFRLNVEGSGDTNFQTMLQLNSDKNLHLQKKEAPKKIMDGYGYFGKPDGIKKRDEGLKNLFDKWKNKFKK